MANSHHGTRAHPHVLRRANVVALGISDGLARSVLILLMLGVTAAVILRMFGIAATGVIELGGLSLLFITFLAAPHVTARDGNVKLELIDSLLSKRTLNLVDIVSVLVQITVAALLLWASAELTLNDMERGTSIGGELRLPRWLVGMVVPVGSALILVQLMRRLAAFISGGEPSGGTRREPTPSGGVDL